MDYGKIIRLVFDGKVYNVSPIEKTRYRLENAYGEYTYPTNVTYGQNENEVYLHFENINNLVFPAYLECVGAIKMGSDYIPFDAFSMEVFLDNLRPVPSDFEHVWLCSTYASGEITIAFDGKVYYDELNHVRLVDVSVVGSITPLIFKSIFSDESKYVSVSPSVTVVGQYCDINGVPL